MSDTMEQRIIEDCAPRCIQITGLSIEEFVIH